MIVDTVCYFCPIRESRAIALIDEESRIFLDVMWMHFGSVQCGDYDSGWGVRDLKGQSDSALKTSMNQILGEFIHLSPSCLPNIDYKNKRLPIVASEDAYFQINRTPDRTTDAEYKLWMEVVDLTFGAPGSHEMSARSALASWKKSASMRRRRKTRTIKKAILSQAAK